MPALDKMVVGLELAAGETVICTVHPSADVTERAGRNPGSTVYGIPVKLADGRQTYIRGGARLVEAMQEAIAGATDIVKVSVTAKGAAGTTERNWDIQRIP